MAIEPPQPRTTKGNEAMKPEFSQDSSRPDWRTNLLLSLDEVMGCLCEELDRSSHLNGYLLAVAVEQVLDDRIQQVALADRASAFAVGSGVLGAHLVGKAIGAASRSGHHARGWSARTKALRATRRNVARLVGEFAHVVMASGSGSIADGQLAASLAQVRSSVLALPQTLRNTTPVLPSCFQTFDLGLDDLRRLSEKLLATASVTGGPVCVVGVRTSGSYLAPLLAAFLRNAGVADVATVTARPGMALLGDMAAAVGEAMRRGARFVVTDDPPVTGSSLLRAVAELERVGVPTGSISVAFPSFLDARVDARLDRFSPVVLPWEEWAVHERLTTEAVRRDLKALLGDGRAITSVELVQARRPRRAEAHVRGVYRVVLAGTGVGDGSGGDCVLSVAVQGVGLGYYGEHVTAVADAIAPYGPRVFGLHEGLLYREWFDPRCRIDEAGVGGDVLAEELAGYVAMRRNQLPVPGDRSVGLAGSRPVWETAAVEISQSYGRAWPVAQVLVVNRVVRRILRVPRPSVIDGTMDLENWFVGADGDSPRLKTVGLQQRAYWHHGLSSYDAVFDLAGAMDGAGDVPASAALRMQYTARTGESVEPERWLLLRLAQLWGRRRRDPASAAFTDAAASRVLQEYYAEVFLTGIEPSAASAPMCALDIDGVLETDHLGFPSLTAASASALGALRRHGYRPLVVTGRSIDEVRERCRAYGLVGGVGEYGSALYLADGDRTLDLVPPEAASDLDTLRARLTTAAGVIVDPRYRHGVRAWAAEPGDRRPLSPETVTMVTAGLPGVRFVRGEGQTDFVAAAVDKGTGIRGLVAHLVPSQGDPTGLPISFAVGDTESDAPMLALASHPAVPAHAPATLGSQATWRASRPYQAGFAQAVDAFLGHRMSRSDSGRLGRHDCPQCELAPLTRDREALLLLLSAGEAGRQGIPSRTLKAALASARTRSAGD